MGGLLPMLSGNYQ